MSTVNIEYIGWRQNHRDKYAHLVWPETGCVHPVPGTKAQKMLTRHPDVYRLAKAETEESLAEAIEADEQNPEAMLEEMREIEAHALRDQVYRMDKKNLSDFAKAKFNIKLDQRKKVDVLRQDVINRIDMFGVA